MMPSSHDAPGTDRGCGERLRNAREAAGLTIAEVSQRLKMPARVVEALEAGEPRADAAVFVRGQLRSYARLLGVRLDDVPAVSGARQIEPAPIVPMSYTPPLQRLADKLMGRMVYIVITAFIVVPVWVATRSHIEVPAPSASLDVPVSEASGAAQAAATTDRPKPLVASIASLPQRTAEKAEPALSLRFSDDSWVEITGPDGKRIEQGLFKAGDRRDFDAGVVGGVVLGNAGTVEVRRNGDVQDLSIYQRADVARFTVSSDGSLAPVAE